MKHWDAVETIHPSTNPVEVTIRVYSDEGFSELLYEHSIREEIVLSSDTYGLFAHAAIKTADYTVGEEWKGIEIRRMEWDDEKKELYYDGGRILRIGRLV